MATPSWIASNSNAEGEFPAEWTMQKDIWGNGVRQADFFLSSAGWGFPTADPVDEHHINGTRLTFTNLTPNMLEPVSSLAPTVRPEDLERQPMPGHGAWRGCRCTCDVRTGHRHRSDFSGEAPAWCRGRVSDCSA
jgi:hypothetical protein